MPSWYYEKADLAKTPSIKNGLSLLQERTFRKEGASYILELGNYLQLQYVTCATACAFFHRFYMFNSFSEYPRYLMATACLFLAGKVEETPKKWKVVWKAATEVLKADQLTGFDGFDHKLLTYERILLQAIQFDLIVEHPHQYITKYAKTLKGSKEKVEKLVQIAWNFANDSLRTTLCLEWEPPIIAIAFLQLAGKFNNEDLNVMQGNEHKNWWYNIFDDLSKDLLEDICHQVLDLYNDSKSGNKLKQDVKKKRHSSKLSHEQKALNGAIESKSAASSTSEDPAKKKSRHSKAHATSTPNRHGTSSKSSRSGTPSAPANSANQSSVLSAPNNTAAPPTVYFAATPATTSQTAGQTVIVYCQPAPNQFVGSQTNTNHKSTDPNVGGYIMSFPSQNPNDAVNKTSSGAFQVPVSAINTSALNGFPHNLYYHTSQTTLQNNTGQGPIFTSVSTAGEAVNHLNMQYAHSFMNVPSISLNNTSHPQSQPSNSVLFNPNSFNFLHPSSGGDKAPVFPSQIPTNIQPYTIPVVQPGVQNGQAPDARNQTHNSSFSRSASHYQPGTPGNNESLFKHFSANSNTNTGFKPTSNSPIPLQTTPVGSSVHNASSGQNHRYHNNNNNNYPISTNHQRDSGSHGSSRSSSSNKYQSSGSSNHGHHYQQNWNNRPGATAHSSSHGRNWTK